MQIGLPALQGESPAPNSAELKQAGYLQGNRDVAGARLGIGIIVHEESHGTVPVRQLCGLFGEAALLTASQS